MKAYTKSLLAALLLIAVAVAGSARAVEPNPPGELAVHVAISSDPDLSKKWVESAPSKGFTIRRIQRLRQGQTAYIAFLITGHTVGPDSRPDVVVDAVIRKPDGTLFAEMLACCSVRYATGKGGFVMADPAIDLKFDASDALGSWTIEASAKDRRAGTTASGKSQLQLDK